jgi:triosephosphate isomerase
LSSLIYIFLKEGKREIKVRKPIIGGNWKMNKGTPSEAIEMLKKLIPLVKNINSVDIVIVPPFTALYSTIDCIQNTNIMIGAQNMYFEEKGAFTGETSPLFLKELGCKFVILGHSERRDIFRETNELVNKKLKKALSLGLNTIVCIGEHLEERETGRTKEVIENQFNNTFKNLTSEEMSKVVIAYEPIWAIGTGKTATPEQAEEIHVIQYGGSIKPKNAEDIFKKDNIDGGLVGGASLQADSLYEVIKAAETYIK